MSTVGDIGVHPRSTPSALVPVLVFLGTVVAVVSSLGAPLVPTIAQVERVPLSSAQWSLTITLLVGAVATPTMGRLGDSPRRRTVVLASLALVVGGCALAALPFGFVALLVGRALQGLGLGLTPLTIAIVRDALPPERARPAAALLSVTTVAGVGLGYPLTGLIVQHFGVPAGFWFGAAVSSCALIAAFVVVPAARHHGDQPMDFAGATLLGIGVAAVMVILAEAAVWGWNSPSLLGAVAAAVIASGLWIRHELQCSSPLIQLRKVVVPAILTADVAALLAGVVMYLLISLITRLVQTPPSAGYGFGSSIVVTGFVLLPFSLASLTANRLAPWLRKRFSGRMLLPFGAVFMLVAAVFFSAARDAMWQLIATMTIAGFGVGTTFAALPGLIVSSVPPTETGSAMGFNQVLRYVGYAAGSALSASVLAARTLPGHPLPLASGYQLAGLLTCGTAAVAVAASVALSGGRHTTRRAHDLAERVIPDPVAAGANARRG